MLCADLTPIQMTSQTTWGDLVFEPVVSTLTPYLPGLNASGASGGSSSAPIGENIQTVTVTAKPWPWAWIIAGAAVIAAVLLSEEGRPKRH